MCFGMSQTTPIPIFQLLQCRNGISRCGENVFRLHSNAKKSSKHKRLEKEKKKETCVHVYKHDDVDDGMVKITYNRFLAARIKDGEVRLSMPQTIHIYCRILTQLMRANTFYMKDLKIATPCTNTHVSSDSHRNSLYISNDIAFVVLSVAGAGAAYLWLYFSVVLLYVFFSLEMSEK